MMSPQSLYRVAVALAVVNLAACGYIKSLFPDKEKDYQYTTEIPALVVPPNLSDNPAFETAPSVPEAVPSDEQPGVGNQTVAESSEASTANDVGSQPTENKSETYGGAAESGSPRFETTPVAIDNSSEPSPVGEAVSQPTEPANGVDRKADKQLAELVVYNDGETRLQIAAGKAIAWRKVGKALSRNSIEISARDLETGYFNVLYDPNERKFEDSSLWDEVKFIYGGIESNDNQYQLKLVENNAKTDVAVLNQDGKPASGGTPLSLLKLLLQTINSDQSD